MQGKLPEWVQTLAGVAIPFGAFDAVLQDEANADVSDDFVKAAGFDGTADANLSNLDSIKTVIQTLRAPESLRQQLEAAFQEEGEHINMHDSCPAAESKHSPLLMAACLQSRATHAVQRTVPQH